MGFGYYSTRKARLEKEKGRIMADANGGGAGDGKSD